MEQFKILFLDFDGVLVTDKHLEILAANDISLRDCYGAKFDPECVELLKQIIDKTNARIVVASTWKMELGLDGIRRMWQERHLPGVIIDVTPDIDPIHRGEEIAVWLDAYGEACRYAIIDDVPFIGFFRDEQMPHLFQVDERIGIDEHTAKAVAEYLNRVVGG